MNLLKKYGLDDMRKYKILWKIEFVLIIFLPILASLLFKRYNWDTSNSIEANIAILFGFSLFLIFGLTIKKCLVYNKNISGIRVINIYIFLCIFGIILGAIFLILQLSGVNYENY